MSGPLRIVMLSDDPERRLALERMFQQARHPATFLAAVSYETYVRHLEQTPVDAVLALIPFKGWDLKTTLPITRILAPSTPFVVVSRSKDVAEAVSWIKEGAREYLLEGDVARLPEVIIGLQRNQTELSAPQQGAGTLVDFLRLVLDHLPVQIAVYDLVGRYRYINTVAVRAPEIRSWLIGKSDFDYCRRRNLPMRIAEARTAAIKKCIAERQMVEYEEIFPSPQNGDRYLTRFFSPALNPEGTVVHVLGSSIDITERKRLETQLQYAQKLESLGVLAGGIAHDFNNLLTVVLGHAELIKAQIRPESRYIENVHAIIQSSHRAASLCNQMLSYAGKSRLVVRPCQVNTIIEEMRDLLDASVTKQIRLKYRLVSNLPVVRGDASQLLQVVMNLVTNASEAMEGREGTVTISTGAMDCDPLYLQNTYVDDRLPAGEYVYIQVEDTGKGMDETTRQVLFDPFFTTKFTGRGLGLAAVLGIVRSHQGAIKIDSRSGEGTTIRVLFPATDSPEPEKQDVGTFPELNWAEGKGLVLIVDDEESLRSMSRIMLEKMGFSVLTAADGMEAVEVFGDRHSEIALVMLDVTMPRMNGEEVFWELRSIRKDIPVLLLSGYGEQILSRALLEDSHADFIQKPSAMADLIDKIRGLMGVM